MHSGYVVAVKLANGNLEAQGLAGLEDVSALPRAAASAWARKLRRSTGLRAVVIDLDTGVGVAGAPDLTFKGDLSERVTLA